MATAPEQVLGFGFAFALFGQGVAWLVTTMAAFYAILRRKFMLHKQWMIRSYVTTMAFVTFRILVDYLPFVSWGVDVPAYYAAMVWTSWVFPLMFVEVFLQFRESYALWTGPRKWSTTLDIGHRQTRLRLQ